MPGRSQAETLITRTFLQLSAICCTHGVASVYLFYCYSGK